MQVQRPRRRGGGWLRLLLVLVLCGLAMVAATAVFSPWIYYTGGHFHPLPMWQGWGKIESPNGHYWLYVRMTPKPSKGAYLSTWLAGSAYLCTPRGDRVAMRLNAGMARHLPLDVTGQTISLSAYYRPAFWSVTGAPEVPQIAMKGVWGKGEIRAAISGLRDDAKSPKLQGLAKGIPVVFEETNAWMPTCPQD